MRRIVRPLLHSALIAALTGCTGISFKQGAGGEDFRRAEAECKSTTAERNAFFRCMDEKGWWTRSMEELSQMGFAPVDEEAAEDVAVPIAATAEASAPTISSTPGAKSTAAPASSQAVAAKKAEASTAAPVKPVAPKDPLSRITIAMWAKAGADGSALMASQAACLSVLGAGHEPDPVAKTVTRGLYDCLRKDGWTGMTLR